MICGAPGWPTQIDAVQVHLGKRANEQALRRWSPAAMLAHHLVSGVEAQTILIRQALGDRRLAGAAAAANPKTSRNLEIGDGLIVRNRRAQDFRTSRMEYRT